MIEYDNLVNFWREYPTDKGGIHLKDCISMEKVTYIKNLLAYVKSDYFFDGGKIIHSGLLPVPYCGNIKNARVYFLGLNPGFCPNDYHAEADTEFRKAAITNLAQKGKNLPFLPLESRFCWWGGAEWWWKKFKPIFELYQKKGISYRESCEDMTRKVASLELFPYHSASFPGGRKLLKIKSVEVMKEFAHALARDKTKLLIVLRMASEWNLPKTNNVLIIPREQARSASIRNFANDIFRVLNK